MNESDQAAVAEILALTRDREFDKADSFLAAQLGACAESAKPLLEGCRALLDWRVAVHQHHPLSHGLTEAVLGVTRLREAGFGPSVDWAFMSLGYAIGMQGDFERGLEWLEVAIADAQARNDRKLLVFSHSHRASLLLHAEEPDRAFAAYEHTLALCQGAEAVLRPGFLSNQAYCLLARARAFPLTDPRHAELANQALRYATEAIEQVGPGHPQAPWLCTILANQGDALHMLGRAREAEAAYRRSLSIADEMPRAKVDALAGFAALLMDLGRHAEAAEMLSQADAITPWDLVNPSVDRILRLQIELARQEGRAGDVDALWERRFQRVRDRDRERLHNVQRFAQLLGQLEQARAAGEQVRRQAEAERERREEQDRFLAMLTHELKNPVGVVRMSFGAMQAEGPAKERIERALASINAIIDRVRVKQQLEHDQLGLTVTPCSVAELARECVAASAEPSRVLVSASDLPPIETDPLLLNLVVNNLIDNALKYSPPGSPVSVVCRPGEDRARGGIDLVVVNVPGAAGLPDPLRAFEKYFRGRGAHHKGGSGLGLYLAKGVSELLGGSLECNSQPDRVEFLLWLPA